MYSALIRLSHSIYTCDKMHNQREHVNIYLPCLSVAEVANLDLKLVRLAPKWNKSGTFSECSEI